jgi:putative NADPH-quinone reductase
MSSNNILVINGHPDPDSFNAALTNAYLRGIELSNGICETLTIRELNFDPNLHFGYRKRTELEPDLEKAQSLIKSSDHLVWIYPVWWGSVPALMKGFIDRVFLPGFAFKKRENSVWWDRYLTGKTARLICTMDTPPWYYWLRYGSPSHKAMKQMTLQYVGIKKVKITSIGPIRLSKESFREKWLKKVGKLGEMDAT